MAIKLLLDTDIGTDVDDAWALALCLASAEIELAGVTLVYGDLDTRARIALKMLHLARRLDVPVYKGLPQPLTAGAGVYWAGHEGSDTDFFGITDLRPCEGGVEFILDAVERCPDELVICSIAPLTNIAEAIRLSPLTMRRVKKLVIMASSYEGEGPQAAAQEHNSTADPVATKLVFESGIPAVVLGLNATKRVSVNRSRVGGLESTPLGNYLAAMTYQYLHILGRDFTYMHDPLAVASTIDPSLVSTRKMRANVLDDGRVAYFTDQCGWLDVCVDVDVSGFEEMLLGRVRSFK